MQKHIIDVSELVKTYDGRNPVLNGLTFSVAQRELVILHGRSGCGKTTLLNVLGGLDRPTSGDIRIEGSSIVDLSEDQLAEMRLRKIGFVFQDYNLLMDLTARENVALPLKFSRRKEVGSVDRIMQLLGIGHVGEEMGNKISGGEAQRVAIARAMINEPAIILADEPTGNLDEESTEIVMEMFELARKEFETTIVLATHDKELLRYATRRMHMLDGKVITT